MLLDIKGRETQDKSKAWAETRNNRFFIRGLHQTLINPNRFVSYNQTEWYQVTEACYRNFIRFLATGSDSALSNANREFITRR